MEVLEVQTVWNSLSSGRHCRDSEPAARSTVEDVSRLSYSQVQQFGVSPCESYERRVQRHTVRAPRPNPKICEPTPDAASEIGSRRLLTPVLHDLRRP